MPREGGVVGVGDWEWWGGEGGLVISSTRGEAVRTTWHAVPGLTRGAHVGRAPPLLPAGAGLPAGASLPGRPDRLSGGWYKPTNGLACKSHGDKERVPCMLKSFITVLF